MPAPHVTAFRHTFIPGTTYRFLLEGTNIESPQSVDLVEDNPSVKWTTNGWMFDGQFLEVTATLNPQVVTPTGPTGPTGHPGHPVLPTAGTDGDGSLTIVVTNPPDDPGGTSISDDEPPIVPAYYTPTA